MENALQMVYGYSPYKLVFGTNPNLPSTMVDKPPPDLSGDTINESFADHLAELHAGRLTFIEAKTSRMIHNGLHSQVQQKVESQFATGNKLSSVW